MSMPGCRLSVLGVLVIAAAALAGCAGQARTDTAEPAAKEFLSLAGGAGAGLPFSSAVKCGNLLFLSGVVGTDLETGLLVSDDAAGQTRQCLEKIGLLLRQAGMDYGDAVNVTVYLTDLQDYDAMNAAYAGYFPEKPPARACVQVAGLVRNARVEISMIAMN